MPPGVQGRRCHERLDHAAHQQHEDEPQRHRRGAPSLVRHRLQTGARAGVDPGPEQPEPDPRGDEDRRRLEEAVRQDQPEEQRPPVVLDHQRPDHRDVEDVGQQQVHHRQSEHPERDAERRHPGVVGPHLGGEVRGGVLAVVPLELHVDEPVGLRGRHQRRLHPRVLEQPEDHHRRHRDVDHHRRDPPAPHPVERRRERHAEELPSRATRPCGCPSYACGRGRGRWTGRPRGRRPGPRSGPRTGGWRPPGSRRPLVGLGAAEPASTGRSSSRRQRGPCAATKASMSTRPL